MASTKDYLKAMCRVSAAFGRGLKKGELLELIIASAVEAMGGKASCLFLVDEEKDLFTPAAHTGLSETYLNSAHGSAQKTLAGLLQQGHLILPDAVAENLDAAKAEGIASLLAVPVMIDGKAAGALMLVSDRVVDFSEEDVIFLSALAAQGGIALDRARLIGQIRRSTKLFFDLSASINSSLDVKEVMEILTVDLCRTLKARAVSVQLIDEQSGELTHVSSHGLSEAFISKGPFDDDPDIVGALRGNTMLTKSVPTDDGVLYRDAKIEEGIITILTVPVKSRDDLIGTMQLFYGTRREFYDDEVTMVGALANQAGLAIQNAACYLNLENDMKDLKEDIWSHRSWF